MPYQIFYLLAVTAEGRPSKYREKNLLIPERKEGRQAGRKEGRKEERKHPSFSIFLQFS